MKICDKYLRNDSTVDKHYTPPPRSGVCTFYRESSPHLCPPSSTVQASPLPPSTHIESLCSLALLKIAPARRFSLIALSEDSLLHYWSALYFPGYSVLIRIG